MTDTFTIWAVRTASRKQRALRMKRRLKREAKAKLDIEAYMKQVKEAATRKQADDIIQTIKAMELVGGDTSELKQRLKHILTSGK